MKTKQKTHPFSVVSEIYENAPYDELTLMIKLHPRLPHFSLNFGSLETTNLMKVRSSSTVIITLLRRWS